MHESITRQAAQLLNSGDYSAALEKYMQLKNFTKLAAWDYQIAYIKRRLALKSPTAQRLEQFSAILKSSLGIEHVYVLNLPHRTDRRERTVKEFAQIGFKASEIEFVTAVYGDLDVKAQRLTDRFKTTPFKNNSCGLSIPDDILTHDKMAATPGVFGYTLSQSEIFHDACRQGFKRFLVFDDDVFFSPNATLILDRFVRAAQTWKILLLGASNYFPGDEAAAEKQAAEGYARGFYHPVPLVTCGSFAICYDASMLPALLELVDSHYGYFDRYILACLYKKYQNDCYALWPPACGADITESDIRSSRDIFKHAKIMGWDASRFAEYKSH